MKRLLWLLPLFVTLQGGARDNCDSLLVEAQASLARQSSRVMVTAGWSKDVDKTLSLLLQYERCKGR